MCYFDGVVMMKPRSDIDTHVASKSFRLLALESTFTGGFFFDTTKADVRTIEKEVEQEETNKQEDKVLGRREHSYSVMLRSGLYLTNKPSRRPFELDLLSIGNKPRHSSVAIFHISVNLPSMLQKMLSHEYLQITHCPPPHPAAAPARPR